MLSDALRGPFLPGLKVTAIAQLEPGGTDDPQALESVKSAALVPVTVTAPTLSAALLPRFVSVTVLDALLTPTVWFPKSSEAGDTVAALPVPVSPTTPVPPLVGALKAPDRNPPADGLNVTFTV